MLLFKRIINSNKLIVEESGNNLVTTYLTIDKTERIWCSSIFERDYGAVSTALCKLTDDVLFAGDPHPIIDALSVTGGSVSTQVKMSANDLRDLVEGDEKTLEGVVVFSGEWITVSLKSYDEDEGMYVFLTHGDPRIRGYDQDDFGYINIQDMELEGFLQEVEHYNDDRSGAGVRFGHSRRRRGVRR